MLMVVGIALLAVGIVLIPAAHACYRLPVTSPRFRRWIGGETVGVVLATIPAVGLIALLNLLADEKARDIGIVHLVAAIVIAAAGWFAARFLVRFGARLERASPEAAGVAAASPGASGPASVSIPEKRAA